MVRALAVCGTISAYQRHKRRGEPVDVECAQAQRDQVNSRAAAKRAASAEVVRLAVSVEPVVDLVSELSEALENLRIVKAAMGDAPANAVAGLSKRREELVSRIARLQSAARPEVSALDQLAARRAERLARASG
jgi:predicted dinucleotide-binding enzyme